MPDTVRVATSLPPNDLSAAQGRSFVRAALHANTVPEIVDTAVLLASELITNAVLHGRSEVELTVEITGVAVKVSAADMNSRMPVLQSADELALDGRGIAIINLLASSWGVVTTEAGKTVWFCLELPRS